MVTVKDLITELERWYNPDDIVSVAMWRPSDVHEVAEDLGLTVSDDIARDIITKVAEQARGFTSEEIQFHLDNLQQGGA